MSSHHQELLIPGCLLMNYICECLCNTTCIGELLARSSPHQELLTRMYPHDKYVNSLASSLLRSQTKKRDDRRCPIEETPCSMHLGPLVWPQGCDLTGVRSSEGRRREAQEAALERPQAQRVAPLVSMCIGVKVSGACSNSVRHG